jgi:hypothetical protein
MARKAPRFAGGVLIKVPYTSNESMRGSKPSGSLGSGGGGLGVLPFITIVLLVSAGVH